MKAKRLRVLPIQIAVGVIPLIVHMHKYENRLTGYGWYPASDGISYDFFLYYKCAAVVLTALIMLLILIHDLTDKTPAVRTVLHERAMAPLAVYMLFMVLSALLSPERSFALLGVGDAFEPLPVQIGYLIIFFYTCCTIRDAGSLRLLLDTFFISSGFTGIISLLQFLNLDPFQTMPGRLLITSPTLWNTVDELIYTFPEHISYGTFYNTNDLLQYFSFVIPLLVCTVFYRGCTRRRKAACAVLFILSVLSLAGGYSKTALIVIPVTSVFAVMLLCRDKEDLKHIGLPLLGILTAVILFFILRFEGISGLNSRLHLSGQDEPHILTDIVTEDKDVLITAEKRDIRISCEYPENGAVTVFFHDPDGQELTFLPAGLSVEPALFMDRVCLDIQTDDGLRLIVSEFPGEGYMLYAPSGKWVKSSRRLHSSFFPDSFLTGRGSLWNNILPRLSSVLLFGEGTNNFVFFYPQDDWVAKLYAEEGNTIDVRAHNLYLQQFTENGGVALITFLIFILSYIIPAIRCLRGEGAPDRGSFPSMTSLGILMGVTAYLITGLTTDSNVNTAPVFWVMLGTGLALL